MEKGYYPEGRLTIRTTSSTSYGSLPAYVSISYKVYIYYTAYEGIVAYDKENPLVGIFYDGYANESPMSNCVTGNYYSDAGIDLSSIEIEEIQKALENEDSEESKKILAKYDSKIIEFVKKSGWGDYILIPDSDENGNTQNFKGSTANIEEWNTEKYMLGRFKDGWMKKQIESGLVKVY